MESPWNKHWLDLQKQYLDALTSAGAKPGWSTQGLNDPFSPLFSPGMGAAAMPPFPGSVAGPDRFFNYAQHVSDLFAQFQSLLKNMTGSEGRQADNWEQLLHEQFETLKSRLGGEQGPGPFDAWVNGVQQSMQAWQSLISPAAPGPGGEPGRDQDWSATIREEFLRAAGLAGQDKLQADLRDAGKYWEKYTEHSRRFQEILKSVDLAALDALRDRFLEMGREGASVSSLREIYALWIDSHEKCWTSLLLSDEFSRAYGEMINSYLELNKRCSTLQARLYGAIGEASSRNRELSNKVEALLKSREEDRREIEALKATIGKLKKKSSAGKTGRKDGNGKHGKGGKKKDAKKGSSKKDRKARAKGR